MNELISVVVPVYNVKQYLDECINSIVSQSYKNLEVVLVDDGSSDGSADICDAWAARDSRVRVIHQENHGVAYTRKNGILSARGDYICCVDSDDIIDEKTCETCLDIFKKNEVEIVVFGVERFGVTDSKEKTYPIISENVLDAKTALEILVKGDTPSYFCNKMYKRNMFDGVDFVVGHLWEDMGAMYQVFLNAKNIYFCNQDFYKYRMRGDSIIHTISAKALEDIFFVQMKRYNDLMKVDSKIADIAFSRLPWVSIRLYDCSLWSKVDGELLNKAIAFMEENKEKVLRLESKKRFVWFYRNRRIYNSFRRLRHKLGDIVKKIK